MTESRSYVPAGGAVLTPYLCCRSAAEAIQWYVAVLGAIETGPRFVDADGRVGHAGLEIDGTPLMLSDAYPDLDVVAPTADSFTYALQLYVPDAAATVRAAEAAGATVERPVADQFHGAVGGVIRDPFGVRWFVSTQQRDVPEAELAAAAAEFQQAPTPEG